MGIEPTTLSLGIRQVCSTVSFTFGGHAARRPAKGRAPLAAVQHLPKFATGEMVGCFGLTEPD